MVTAEATEGRSVRKSKMAKVVVRIPHVAWRDGRPRFVPGTSLRAMGYRGKDLKHDDGTWFQLMEAKTWSDSFCENLEKSRQRIRPVAADLPGSQKELATLSQAFEEWIKARKAGKAGDSRRTRKMLSGSSVQLYRQMMKHIERDYPATWSTPLAAFRPQHMEQLYDRLYRDKPVSVSAAIMQCFSSLFSWASKRGMIGANPMRDIEVTRPEPDLRIGTIEEMRHLIDTADAMGWPEIADSIMLGLMTGQRKGDRLNMTEAERSNGRILLKQQKTGAIVDIPEQAALTRRLDANYERRQKQAAKINWPGIVINEKTQRPFDDEFYRRTFLAIVEEAARTMPSLQSFRDKHLRKTCVTWLANAGCTVAEIAQITGHTLASVHNILKHYLAPDPERATAAITKLGAWLDKKEAKF